MDSPDAVSPSDDVREQGKKPLFMKDQKKEEINPSVAIFEKKFHEPDVPPIFRNDDSKILKASIATYHDEESDSEEENRKKETQSRKEANLYLANLEKLFEEKKTKKKACPTMRNFFLKNYNFLPFPLLYILLILIAINVFLVIVWFKFQNVQLWGIVLWRWGAYGDIVMGTLVGSRLVVLGIMTPIKYFFGFTAGYYFISGLHGSITILAWVSLSWGGSVILLEGLNTYDREIRGKIFLSVFLITLLFIVKLVIDKVILVSFQRQKFWSRITEFLYREKVIRMLLLDPKQAKLNRGMALRQLSSWRFLVSQAKIKDDFSKQNLAQESLINTKKLMANVDKTNKGYIVIQDLETFFEDPKDIKHVLSIFDTNADGRISYDEVMNAVTRILKDRQLLYATLHDTENLGSIVGHLTSIVFWILMVIMVLSIFGVDIAALLVPFGTSLLALAFIFGNSLRTAFESFIFIFVVNPYEVGDKIQLDGMPNMFVSRINLLTTEFFTVDGRHVIIPNTDLADHRIFQHQRSRDYAVSFTMNFHGSTSKRQITKFKKKLEKWINLDSEHTPWDLDSFIVVVSDVSDVWLMKVDVWVSLKDVNWVSWSKFAIPKERMLVAVHEICQELKIEYFKPHQPVRMVDEKNQIVSAFPNLPKEAKAQKQQSHAKVKEL